MRKLTFLLFLTFGPAAFAAVNTGPNISSGTYGGVTITSTTASPVPARKLKCRYTLVYTNMSSTEAVNYGLAFSSPTNLLASGDVLFTSSTVSIDVDPLSGLLATYYFLAPAGSTGVQLRYQDLGCAGGYE